MCGIPGFASIPQATDAAAVDTVHRMTNRMRQRGPDAEVMPYVEASQSGVLHLAVFFGLPVVAVAFDGLYYRSGLNSGFRSREQDYDFGDRTRRIQGFGRCRPLARLFGVLG
jgi:hypothetical protein